MKSARHLAIVGLVTMLTGCATDTLFGFKIGDISGLWAATSYELVDNADAGVRVDLIARDGASMTLSVSSGESGQLASAQFNDGMGSMTSSGGAIDIRDGTLALGPDTFIVDHNGDLMTLTNGSAMFDFGGGSVPVTHIIRLSRI